MTRIEPEIFVELDIQNGRAPGYLAVDRLVDGKSMGGIRIIPDPEGEEVIHCARTMSLKYGFMGLRMGGAKAAIKAPPDLDPASRREILLEFGNRVSELITSERWIPAIDMGSDIADLQSLYDGAGVKKDFSNWKGISNISTAWSVYFSTLAALKFLRREIKGRTFVAQGFGKVGTEYCKLMCRAGAKMLAVSTRLGGIYSEAGFDINRLIDLQKTHGDRFVLHVPEAERLDPAAVLEVEADIAVPCARSWAINNDSLERIKAGIIPCAANWAMDRDVEEKLMANGKIVIPDFVANSGGIFGSVMKRHLSPPRIRDMIEDVFQKRVFGLIEQSQQSGRTIADMAGEQIEGRLKNPGPGKRRKLLRALGPLVAIAPVFLKDRLLYSYYAKKYYR